jgi:hypothetical protein
VAGPRGTTLLFDLDHAPFAPSFGHERHRDGTVLVYVPPHYRLPESGVVDVVAHFHGHRYTAERATNGHVLREQLDDSQKNAILVVPQLAVLSPDSSAGQLERDGGLSHLLKEVVRELRRQRIGEIVGEASLVGARKLGTVCVSAHSGGYNAAAHCLERGGIEVSECWLFDSLYGRVGVFRDWMLSGKHTRKRRKIVSFYAGGEVKKNSLELVDALIAAGIDCRHERAPGELSRADLLEAEALLLATPDDHVGAAFAQNNLRDCLQASALTTCGKTGWFENLQAPRKIDRRGGG